MHSLVLCSLFSVEFFWTAQMWDGGRFATGRVRRVQGSILPFWTLSIYIDWGVRVFRLPQFLHLVIMIINSLHALLKKTKTKTTYQSNMECANVMLHVLDFHFSLLLMWYNMLHVGWLYWRTFLNCYHCFVWTFSGSERFTVLTIFLFAGWMKEDNHFRESCLLPLAG